MNKTAFFKKLKRNPRPVVVDFWAPWCAPCRFISPALEKLAAEYEGQVDLWKINTDEETALAAALGIRSIPTVAVYRDGEEILRRVGAQPEVALRQMFTIATGETEPTVTRPLGTGDRVLRLGAGLVVMALGVWAIHSWALALFGAVIAFTGVYDRCPLWQALTARLRGM